MHELGHSLNVGHAGKIYSTTDFDEYGDESGVMGYSYGYSDWPRMCFNAAKSWQLGWYADKHEIVTPLSTPSWSGTLVGIAEYDIAGENNHVLVKLETGTEIDYYMNFNRQTGINSETQQSGDQVLITEQGGNGEAYSSSKLHAELSRRGDYTIENFGGSGLPVTITVNSIDTATTPGYAGVTITSDALTSDPTSSPNSPSASPSGWPSESPSRSPTTSPTFSPTGLFCITDEDCENERISMFACSAYYCIKNSCQLQSRVPSCNCNGTCDRTSGENESTCPSDCAERSSLSTTLAVNTGQSGNMFDVEASNDIQITSFDVHAKNDEPSYDFEVWTKVGTYVGHETNADGAWTLIQNATGVTSNGPRSLTPLPPLPPIIIRSSERHAFYITLTNSTGMLYRKEAMNTEGAMFKSDANLRFYVGIGKAYGNAGFSDSFSPRIWSGTISYVLASSSDVPSMLPSEYPSELPT